MAINLSKGLTETVKTNKLESDRHLAMADLILMGWNDIDAYVVAFSPEMTLSMTYVKNRVKAITKSPEFQKYISNRSVRMGANDVKNTFTTSKGEKKEFKVLNKQDVLSEIQYMLSITSPNDIKTRSDLLKQLSDLQGYKDDVVEGAKDTRHYYLPKKCFHCEWYEGRQKDKIL